MRQQPTSITYVAPDALTVPDSPEDMAIAAWLAGQKTDNTRRSYRQAMAQWRGWLRGRGVPLAGPRRPDADAWRNHLTAIGRKPTTVDARLIAIRSFYDYWVDEGMLPANPIGGAKLLNLGPHNQTPALSEEQVKALAKSARDADPLRMLLVLFLAMTGCRASEALNLQVSDLGEQSGFPVVTFTRKGGRRDVIPLDSSLAALLSDRCGGLDRDAFVFAGSDGVRMTYAAARHAVYSIGKSAGIGTRKKPLHPHMLRAALITILLDRNHPIDRVQGLAGHKMTDTTRRYDRGKGKLSRFLELTETMASVMDMHPDGETSD